MSEGGEYVRTKIRRAEIVSYVVVAMVIVGCFFWVGIIHLEGSAQDRSKRSAAERKVIQSNQRTIITMLGAICDGGKFICPKPVVVSGG